MKHYAQIDGAGVCVGLLETSGAPIDAPHMVEIQPGGARLGQRWTGAAWEDVAPTDAEAAQSELEGIDRATGMTRAMREALLSVAAKVGANVAYLQEQETKAAAARLRKQAGGKP